MDIKIRILNQDDAPIYRALRLKSFQEEPFAFSESYEDEKNKTESDFADELQIHGQPEEWFVLGAFAGAQKLIGFVKFRRDLRSKARHKSMLHAMYVDLEYRSKGVGRSLICKLLERTCQIEGLEQIHLWVLCFKNPVCRFYQESGFEKQGPVVRNDLKIEGKYVDAQYMVKYL